MKDLLVFLIGRANVGKTFLFNKITGSNAATGNWHGVTVCSNKEYLIGDNDNNIEIIDLPGISSLDQQDYTADEKCTIDQIFFAKTLNNNKIFVNIVNAQTLRQDLYLSLQLLELGLPLIICLHDINDKDKKLNKIKISRALACPVISSDDLESHIKTISRSPQNNQDAKFCHDQETKCQTKCLSSCSESKFYFNHLTHLTENSRKNKVLQKIYHNIIEDRIADSILNQSAKISYWHILHYLEYRPKNGKAKPYQAIPQNEFELLKNNINKIIKQKDLIDHDMGLKIARSRHEYLNEIVDSQSYHNNNSSSEVNINILDRIVLNRWLSFPSFILTMYFIFCCTIKISPWFQSYFDQLASTLVISPLTTLSSLLFNQESITLTIEQGLGSGIKTVISFMPLIFFMYLLLAILEQSGYMARSSLIMEGVLQKLGLSGKAIIPLIIGFGCNVPAIMATRTLSCSKERKQLIFMIPFMSCGARLAVFSLFASFFFTSYQSEIIWLLYLTGIILAVFTAILLKDKNNLDDQYDITILPSYRIPSIKNIITVAYNKTLDFIKGASFIVIIVSTFLYSLAHFDGKNFTHQSQDSLLAQIGKNCTWLFKPMGLKQDNWQETVALITGIFAKEVIVGSIASLHSISNDDDDELQKIISTKFSSEGEAFSYMLFVLLYFPCVSVFATMKREIGLSYAIVSGIWTTLSAYSFASIFYSYYTIWNSIFLSLLFALITILIMIILIKSISNLIFSFREKTKENAVA